MIEIENLRKIYRSGFFLRPKIAVDNLSFSVSSNQIFGFLGQNGAGKTSTIKILVGLSHPTSGDVKVLGKTVRQVEMRKLLGYVPEAPYFYEYLTPYEAMRFYGSLHEIPNSILKKRIPELLKLVELEEHQHRRIRTFSKGMRQRLGIAQALVNDPQLVIMDEPSSGLDPLGRKLVKDIIVKLKEEGKTIFFSSHVLPDVEAICDEIALIHKGKLIQKGSIDDLLGSEPKEIEIIARKIKENPPQEIQGRYYLKGNFLYIFVPNEKEKEKALNWIRKQDGEICYIIPHRFSLEEYFKKLELASS
ncbi:MAG: ABC transporter ATP-binding protein [Planctomycetota bacterium]|nr:MAG: ABC transporter ATP-binding protein [Planctomycetota bacterium]